MSYPNRTAAKQAGQIAKKRLDDRWPKWKLRVWENLGWHYDLRHGPISLSESSGGGYFCMVSESIESDGTGGRWPEFPHHGDTPEDAVATTIAGFNAAITKHVAFMMAHLYAMPMVLK